MAKYHEIGRFSDKSEEDIDWDSAIYHETHAAELGELEAILTMAKLYLGQERAVLVNCLVEDHPENVDLGMDYMVEAAEAGDRGAMIFVAKAFHTGDGLGTRRYHDFPRFSDPQIFEPRYKKTNVLHMRKQRRRSASR